MGINSEEFFLVQRHLLHDSWNLSSEMHVCQASLLSPDRHEYYRRYLIDFRETWYKNHGIGDHLVLILYNCCEQYQLVNWIILFIYGLFNDAVNCSDGIVSNYRMISEY
jgi:hypothetical protein